MKRSISLAFFALTLCAGVYGDTVAGYTTGSYHPGSATIGSVSGPAWNFAHGANASSITYDGGPDGLNGGTCPTGDTNTTCFGLATTPVDINLGSLTLSNGGNGGFSPGSYSAKLDLTVTFTTPTGSVVLSDPLTLTVDNGSKGFDLVLTSLPSNAFSFNNVTYTVTIDGLFDSASGGNSLADLLVDNPGNGKGATTGTAFLRGTVTSSPGIIPTSTTPEPGSISLLLTAIGGAAFSLRRKVMPRS